MPRPDPCGFLVGGGEMGERTRSLDWSKTPLGPIVDWPQSLKIAVRIMLGSRYAMWLGWGPEFTFLYNDAYARMTLGPKHPRALGRSAREVWAEIWNDVGPRAERVIATGEATWDEGLLLFLERHGFPEETYHTFSYSPIPTDEGGVGGMLCVVTEDTERSIGERRLRTLRELAARTTEVARSAREACQAAADILAANPRDLPFVLIYLLDAHGRTAELVGATGLPAGSAAAPQRADLADADGGPGAWPLLAVLRSGQAEVVSNLNTRFGTLPGGVWPESPHQAVVLPMMKSGQSQLAGFVVAGISPRRVFNDDYRGFLDLLAGHVANAVANARAYEEERQRAETLAELDRAKTAFFSNVSHEFRTPLTLMLGPVADLLSRSHTDLTPAAADQLEVVSRNGLRLLRLVNTLLDFSRIEAGRVRAVFQPTDLATLTAELASVFRAAIERAGLRLTVDCPKLPEPVFVDPEMWEKIVLNLLSNAFKFTFEGEIAVSLEPADGGVQLRVRDTGTGIPEEEMSRLFERFHRVQNARGRTHEGSGIGLALVQELVRLHGGAVTVESAIGRGTTFTVRIPCGSGHLPADQIGQARGAALIGEGAGPYVEEALRWLPDAAPDEPRDALPALRSSLPVSQPAPDSTDDERPRVLVADDNADMRHYIARLLAEPFQVEVVPDGEAALAAARRRPPALVLTDVMMPRLDGFGLLRELRADPRTSSLPVIMLSARAGEESRVEGMQAGADDYLVKPFSARELLARVSAHVQMARLRQEATQAILDSEARLRESEERLRVTLASIGDAVITTDTEGRVLFLNGVAESLTGWTNAEAVGQPLEAVFTIVDEDSRQPVRNPATRALKEGVIVGLANHTILVARDGAERPIDDSAAPIRNREGQVIGCVLVFRDVTDRRRQEAELRDWVRQFQTLAESIPQLAWMANPDGHIFWYNRRWYDYTGTTLEQMQGWGWRSVHDPDVLPSVMERWEASIATGQPFDMVFPLKGSDGVFRPFLTRVEPVKDDAGRVVRWFGTNTDITDQKRAEAALRESEAHFRSMADNAPAMVWVSDLSASRTYISRQWCEYTGTTFEQNLGLGWIDCVHPDDREQSKILYSRANLQRAPFNIDYRLRRHDGEYRWMVDAALPRFENGAFQGYVGCVFDVHERKRLEGELREAAARLSEADRRKDEFLATLAHELRNPLAPIRMGLEILKLQQHDPQSVEQVRGMLERQTRQLITLVDDLLDVSRITRGKFELRKCRIKLSDVVQSAVEASQPFIDQARHSLSVTLPEAAVYLDADPHRLSQVVSNLLNNAAKYTPEGGRIWLTAQRQGNDVLLSVKDTGIGIPPEMKTVIFEMFAQIERPMERGYTGLGIGLTLVKSLVEMHNGRVDVFSDGDHQGSEFTIRLPVLADRPSDDGTGGPAVERPVAPTTRRVLIVDDNQAAAETLSLVVKMLGSDVRLARNGEEAVRMAAEYRPDVVLMDIGMPRMNGYEAAQHIRRHPWGANMLLVALTGWGQDEDKRRTKEAGFDFHLVKPAEPSELERLFMGINSTPS